MPDRKPRREVLTGHEPKICVACGRPMEWRKSWAKNWDAVKYCSDRCRSGKAGAQEQGYEAVILRLLRSRGEGKTICPSEAARAVGGDDRSAWEPLMEPVRQAAARLVFDGKLVITQHGEVVDGAVAKGPLRFRLR